MQKHDIWIGFDVGMEKTSLCAIGPSDELVAEGQFATSGKSAIEALLQLKKHNIRQIACETGAIALHMIRALKEAGFKVVVYEAWQVSRYLRVRFNKTDTNDARGLAEIAKLGRTAVARVHVKSDEVQRLRSQLIFRHRLTQQRVACEGMIRSMIALNGGKMKRSPSAATLQRNVGHELTRMREELGVDLRNDLWPLVELAVSLRNYLADLEKKMRSLAKDHPVCSRFMEMPGIGTICAISFYTAIENPERFKQAADVGAYLGLTPKVSQSGQSLVHGRISRRGNKLTRSHLTMAASIILIRCPDFPLKTWAKAIAERAGPGKARVALARKLAVVMLAIWKSGTRFDSNFRTSSVSKIRGPRVEPC